MTSVVARVLWSRVVAILRAEPADALPDVIAALVEGGIDVVEIPLTVPGALAALKATRRALGDRVCLGAGSVVDRAQLRSILDAGCEFAVAPNTDRDLITEATRLGFPFFAGALSPSEIVAAASAGAPIVKVFPGDAVGPEWLRAIAGPLPQIRLLPTGGISAANAVDYLKAGAAVLGVGSALAPKQMILERDWDGIRKLAKEFRGVIDQFERRS